MQSIAHFLYPAAAGATLLGMSPKPFIPTRWLLLSALQKSIRRNRVEFALSAARRLHQTEPLNLLRRLKVIAVEDVACGDLPLVHRVLTAQQLDLPVLLELVAAMCGSVKDRSACDLT